MLHNNLVFKNDALKERWTEYFNFLDSNQASSEEQSLKWFKKHPDAPIYGYVDSLLEVIATNDIKLDLTYDTIENLPKACIVLYFSQNSGYTLQKNAHIIAKTVAAYLTLLAVNEHGYDYKTTLLPKSDLKRIRNTDTLWSDCCTIKVKGNAVVDMLPSCIDALKPSPILAPMTFTFHLNPVIKSYERLSGVSLNQHGFTTNILIP